MTQSVILLILGILILLLGRKLFWLSVAVIGFVVGAELAPELLQHQSQLVMLGFAFVLGVIGMIIAVLLQQLAIGVAGFFFGGQLAMVLMRALAFYHHQYAWIYFIVGGIIGAILLLSFFDWGLILLTSLLGAHMIVDFFHLAPTVKMALFAVLAVIGIVCQASISKGKARE